MFSKMLTLTKTIILSVTYLILTSTIASADAPVYQAKFELGFMKDPVCNLNQYNGTKMVQAGRGNLSHDENTISWISSCVVPLPANVKYCTLASQQIGNPDALVSWHSGFQKKVLRAKLISEADINPGFGSLKASYLCFD